MNRIKPLFLAWLTALLIGLISSGPSLADGDGGDGGGDDAGMDDGGDGQDDGMDHDGGGHHGGHHGHHGHHHHSHVIYGWGWGPGFYPGYGFGAFGYYPPFYGYPPRVVLQPTAPPVYIEQQNPSAAPAAPASTSQPGARYWHYCQGEGGYYPDVKECPEGWVQVAPQAQSAGPEQTGQP